METKIIKAFGTEAINVPLHSMNIKRRELQPHDVEMKILFCGICHSDLHQINEAFDRLQKGDVKYRFVIDMASIQ